jgi:acetyltransferase-like isoleucine patch superfamily enzyme
MGRCCSICKDVLIFGPENISFGDRVQLNEGVILQSSEGASITIGSQVNIAYGTTIITGSLDFSDGVSHDRHVASSVVIEDFVVINARAIILPGVTIGKGAVVAAGSLVTQDVKPHTMVFGVPARAIKVFHDKQQGQEASE